MRDTGTFGKYEYWVEVGDVELTEEMEESIYAGCK